MADFSTVPLIRDNLDEANRILTLFREIYARSVEVQSILTRYNTDPAFKAEADHLFSQAQIAELGQMITQVTALKNDWEANHKSPLLIR
jgi:hypothetical protein